MSVKIIQGMPFSRSWQWKKNGLPINITDYTAHLKARKYHFQTPVLNLSSDNGGLTKNNITGTVFLNLTPAQTALLNFDELGFDILLTNNTTHDAKRLEQNSFVLSRTFSV